MAHWSAEKLQILAALITEIILAYLWSSRIVSTSYLVYWSSEIEPVRPWINVHELIHTM